MLNSYYRRLGPINFPPFQARQKYMHTFDLASPQMPEGLEDYLESVKLLCERACAWSGIGHMTVDEKVVGAGMSQRRPGPHVDGCFYPSRRTWGHDEGPGWNHMCNNISGETYKRMPVIVAASVEGCKAWEGQFDGEPKSDGDLSHLHLEEGKILSRNTGYLLSPDCIHESMVFQTPTQRSFLRIALPVDFQV